MATFGSIALKSLYKSHEITPADLKTREDVITYFGQERRNVVFVLRRTSARSRDDVLHKRLRHFLKCVSETDIDADLLDNQAVLPTTLYTIFSYVDNHGRFLPEEKYCAKLLYADYLLHGWNGRTTAFTWSDEEWYPFSQVNAFKPQRGLAIDVTPKRASLLRQHSESGIATRHARRAESPKAVKFNNVTNVIEYDHLSQEVVKRSSSLDTGRDRQARRLTRVYSTNRRRSQRLESPMLDISGSFMDEMAQVVDASFKRSGTIRCSRSSMRGRHPPTSRPNSPVMSAPTRHPRPPASRPNSPAAMSASPSPPPSRGSDTDAERLARMRSPPSRPAPSPPPSRGGNDTDAERLSRMMRSPPSRSLKSPSPVHKTRGVSPLRQVSTMSPIAASPEEAKKMQEACLVDSINKLRSEIQSIDIKELPMLPSEEHMLLGQRVSPVENTQPEASNQIQDIDQEQQASYRTQGIDQSSADEYVEQEPQLRKVPGGSAGKRYGRRSLQALGPVRLRVCSFEKKARSAASSPLCSPTLWPPPMQHGN